MLVPIKRSIVVQCTKFTILIKSNKVYIWCSLRRTTPQQDIAPINEIGIFLNIEEHEDTLRVNQQVQILSPHNASTL